MKIAIGNDHAGPDYKKAIASLSVLGAHIDRIRPGGYVNLKLYHPSETIANKIGNSCNRGIVVMQSASSNSSSSTSTSTSASTSASNTSNNAVEVLFLEKESTHNLSLPFCIQEEYGNTAATSLALSAVSSTATMDTGIVPSQSQPVSTSDLVQKQGLFY